MITAINLDKEKWIELSGSLVFGHPYETESKALTYKPEMDFWVNQVGTIWNIWEYKNVVEVMFSEEDHVVYSYPLNTIEKHLVKERLTDFKITFKMPLKKGEDYLADGFTESYSGLNKELVLKRFKFDYPSAVEIKIEEKNESDKIH